MVAVIYTSGIWGCFTFPVQVEVDILPGLMNMSIVGLPDYAIKESRMRIRSALVNSGFEFPVRNIVVNLAPADQPKEGGLAEFAIAAAILVASGQLGAELFAGKLLLGSLSLDGSLQGSRGILPGAIEACKHPRIDALLAPQESAAELSAIPDLKIYPLQGLRDLRQFAQKQIAPLAGQSYIALPPAGNPDMAEIFGQQRAKRALAFAAIGQHHALLVGAPGTGKTMLSRAFSGILPAMSARESFEVTQIYSAAGLISGKLVRSRPFRSPHHTASDIALVGGGSQPMPGEISLAHHGVLFLDELLEFKGSALQALREPMEEGLITVSRARGSYVFPANFLFLGATNPCSCGYIFSRKRPCSCRISQIQQMQRKVFGPFLDRISLEIETSEPDSIGGQTGQNSAWWIDKIAAATLRMNFRNQGVANGKIPAAAVWAFFSSGNHWNHLVQKYAQELSLSHRSVINSLRLALSIMDFSEQAEMSHDILEEAFSYRIFNHYQQLLLQLSA